MGDKCTEPCPLAPRVDALERANEQHGKRAIFDLRVKSHTIVEIQNALNMSESMVNRRIRNIKRKIYKVL